MINGASSSDGAMATHLPTIDPESAAGGGCGGVSRESARERRCRSESVCPSGSLHAADWCCQSSYLETSSNVHEHGLHTVCEEARCPNVHDCWGRGTATFMVAGEVCTRGCRFCAVGTVKAPPALDSHEPDELAEAVARMGLSHAVITVVNRDDLPGRGRQPLSDCILAVSQRSPEVGLDYCAPISTVTSMHWRHSSMTCP
ncbi:MAG: hypothetical protein Ct9H300mP30_4410 [Methanobacteriota archaeon]|nr:MAG: hypothetical protein Ct9H300mP30_4410 [Euryarchaeota archaeon]